MSPKDTLMMSQILEYSEFSHWLRTLLNFCKYLLQEVLFFFCLLLLEHILKTQDWAKEATASERHKMLI